MQAAKPFSLQNPPEAGSQKRGASKRDALRTALKTIISMFPEKRSALMDIVKHVRTLPRANRQKAFHEKIRRLLGEKDYAYIFRNHKKASHTAAPQITGASNVGARPAPNKTQNNARPPTSTPAFPPPLPPPLNIPPANTSVVQRSNINPSSSSKAVADLKAKLKRKKEFEIIKRSSRVARLDHTLKWFLHATLSCKSVSGCKERCVESRRLAAHFRDNPDCRDDCGLFRTKKCARLFYFLRHYQFECLLAGKAEKCPWTLYKNFKEVYRNRQKVLNAMNAGQQPPPLVVATEITFCERMKKWVQSALMHSMPTYRVKRRPVDTTPQDYGLAPISAADQMWEKQQEQRAKRMRKTAQIKGNGPDVLGLRFEAGEKQRKYTASCIVMNLIKTFGSHPSPPSEALLSTPISVNTRDQHSGEESQASYEDIWMWRLGLDGIIERLVDTQGVQQCSELSPDTQRGNSPVAGHSEVSKKLEDGVATMLRSATKTFLTSIIETAMDDGLGATGEEWKPTAKTLIPSLKYWLRDRPQMLNNVLVSIQL